MWLPFQCSWGWAAAELGSGRRPAWGEATVNSGLARLGQRAGAMSAQALDSMGGGVSIPDASGRESGPEEGNTETCSWGGAEEDKSTGPFLLGVFTSCSTPA